MKTVFKNGPGLFACATRQTNPRIDAGVARIYLARLEAVDLPQEHADIDDDTRFEVLFAQAENNPEVAHALLQLHAAIGGNLEMLKSQLQ